MRGFALSVAVLAACGPQETAPAFGAATGGSSSTVNRTPYEAFQAYAAKKLGVAPDKLNGGGPIDADTAAKMPHTVGRLWPYAFQSSANTDLEANGWATADGTVITAGQNLGRLFDEAWVWGPGPTPNRNAKQLAELLAWSFGMGNRVIGDSPQDKPAGPSLERKPDGNGQLVFTIETKRPNFGDAAGGPPNYTTIIVTLTRDHKATLARSDTAALRE